MRKLVCLLALNVFCHSAAFSQIVFHDIVPDTTINSWNVYSVELSGKAHTTGSFYFDVWWHPTPEVVVTSVLSNPCELLFDQLGNFPAKLDSNENIDSTGQWKATNYDPLNSGGSGNWRLTNTVNKYLGFRFKKSTAWYYGWLKMTVASDASFFTVHEWAYDSTGNKIKAGQKTAATYVSEIKNSSGLQIYPNPATNKIFIKEAKQISITDLSGKILTVPCVYLGHVVVADISILPTGTYLVHEGDNSTLFTKQTE